jgi:hypothetical protein
MNNRILNSILSTIKQNINQQSWQLLWHAAALEKLSQELLPLLKAPQLL